MDESKDCDDSAPDFVFRAMIIYYQHNQQFPTRLIPIIINTQQSITLKIVITQSVELPQLSQYKRDQFIEAFDQTLGNPTILLTKVWEIFTF